MALEALEDRLLLVHDLGVFQLDRNACVAGAASLIACNPDPGPATIPSDDWDRLYNALPGVGGSATADVFALSENTKTNPLGSLGTQFQGGGSKDNNDLDQWLWNPGEPLDKDDILDAYAAAY